MAHTDQNILSNLLRDTRKKVEIGALYKHYKSEGLYRVVAVALDEETQTPCVVYQGLYGKGILWIRPMDVFLQVMKVNGKKITKFIKLEKY